MSSYIISRPTESADTSPNLSKFLVEFKLDHDANLIQSIYLDFRRSNKSTPIGTVINFTEAHHAFECTHSIRLARPDAFRKQGETLVYDTGEGYVTRETSRHFQEAVSDSERRGIDDLNRAIRLSGASKESGFNLSVRRPLSTSVSENISEHIEYAKNAYLFCTAIEPTSQKEEEDLIASLPPEYTKGTHIHSPREFAFMLGSAYVNQFGATNQGTLSQSLDNARGVIRCPSITVVHGPVVYVDDPYLACEHHFKYQESSGWALASIFTKSSPYQDQREYRFVTLDKRETDYSSKIVEMPTNTLDAMRHLQSSPMIVPDIDTSNVVPSPDSRASQSHPTGVGTPVLNIDEVSTSFSSSPKIEKQRTSFPPKALEDDITECVGLYPAVLTLQDKIDGVLGLATQFPERRQPLASAGWYADRALRALCRKFGNPITGIRITDDNDIVIDIHLSHWRTTQCKMAVTPSGQHSVYLKRVGDSTSTILYTNPSPNALLGLDDSTLDRIAEFEAKVVK